MSASNQRHPNLRYLKARIQPFFRPTFLVSVTVFSMLILAVVGYWQHPEWLEGEGEGALEIALNPEDTETQERIANSGLSLDELAAGAEQGNLAELLQDFDQSLLLPQAPPSQQKRKRKEQNQKSLEQLIQEQQSQTQTNSGELFLPSVPKAKKVEGKNPFATSVQDFLSNPTSSSLNSQNSQDIQEQLAPQSPLFNQNPPSNPTTISPLQQALNKLETPQTDSQTESQERTSESPQNTFIPSNLVTESGNRVAPSSTSPQVYTPTSRAPIPSAPPNAYTFLTQPQSLEVVPSPTPGLPFPQTTPPPEYNLPNNFGQITQQPVAPANPFNQSSSTNPFGVGSSFQQSQTPLNQPQDPFGIPRSTPGRYIGGGQINTFSNP